MNCCLATPLPPGTLLPWAPVYCQPPGALTLNNSRLVSCAVVPPVRLSVVFSTQPSPHPLHTGLHPPFTPVQVPMPPCLPTPLPK